MPVIDSSTYRPSLIFRNRHLNTMYAAKRRKVRGVWYSRERLELPDGDFLDLDWSMADATGKELSGTSGRPDPGSSRAVVVCHGLEGTSRRAYVKGSVRALNRAGWDAAAVNYRGCSGQPNRLLRSYHAGATDDLHEVVSHVRDAGKYETMALVGFSLGGNLVLKYIGEQVFSVPDEVKMAAVVSAPCDLASSVEEIGKLRNWIYQKRFLRMLHDTIRAKMKAMPGKLNDDNYSSIRSLRDFDDRYAPMQGFADADDYYSKPSSGQFLSDIGIPTLIINARDDPFLSPQCYPVKVAGKSKYLHLEMPRHGGHMGFVSSYKDGSYWHERRIVEFLMGTG